MNGSQGRQRGFGAEEASDRLSGRFSSSHDSVSSQVAASISSFTAPTDGAFGTISMPRRRVSRRDLVAIADSLSDRDWDILTSVATHRFLNVDQIRRLHFFDLSPGSSARTTQKVLQRLRRDRLLGTLDRQIGGVGFGSSGLVHYLDVVGYRLLDQENGLTVRRHVKDPTATFLQHTLAVVETHLRLVEADHRGDLELVRCELEPSCWRRYVGLGGAALWLKSDLYVETTLERGSLDVDGLFIEVDLGTESIPRLTKKCHDYQGYERTGIEQGEDDTEEFPLVVWSMTHRNMATAERRRRSLREAIEHDRKLDSNLFRVIAPDQLLNLIRNGGDL